MSTHIYWADQSYQTPNHIHTNSYVSSDVVPLIRMYVCMWLYIHTHTHTNTNTLSHTRVRAQTLRRSWIENVCIGMSSPFAKHTGNGGALDLAMSDLETFQISPVRPLLKQVPTYADVCWCMLTYALVRPIRPLRKQLPYVVEGRLRVCWRVLTCRAPCW
jgi:hypothetical protein